MTTTQPVTDWKREWFDIEDAAYLNTATHAAMPCVSLRAMLRKENVVVSMREGRIRLSSSVQLRAGHRPPHRCCIS